MKRLLTTLILVLAPLGAYAQTVTLTPSVTSGNGSLATTLTWSTTPAAASCEASGHASWSGSRAASGTQELPPLTLSGSYTLTLECTWPGDTSATVRWVAPTENTDGTALAKCSGAPSGPCLASFRVRRSLSPTMASPVVVAVNDPEATSHEFTGLAAGTHYFAVTALNGAGVESDPSNVASKVITATQTRTESVTVTVNPKPAAPAITVE